MAICQTQLTPVRCPPLQTQTLAGTKLPQTLWNQLEPLDQQRLAQQVAELIWRLRRASVRLEEGDHEPS